MSLCLGVINIGTCKKASVKNDTIIEKQTTYMSEILNNHISSTIAESSSSMGNIVEFNIVSEGGTVIIRDIDLSQYAELHDDSNIKVKEIIKDDATVKELVDMLVDVGIKQNSGIDGIFGSGKSEMTTNFRETVTNNLYSHIRNEFQNISTHFVLQGA